MRWIALGLIVACASLVSPAAHAQSRLSPGFAAGEAGLSPSERAGREIWFFATAGNDRFHTYVMPQRLGVAIDWYGILNAKSRDRRFRTWGLINDPDCCVPGSGGCPATSLEQTYGFDFCPGDEALLAHVGRTGYRDPACDFEDAPWVPDGPHGDIDQRESACGLKFGTSAGVIGFRKFPNPRFDAGAWRSLNGGSLASWDGYRSPLAAGNDPADPDSRNSRLFDGAIEPPFRIGMACGGCHAGFDPLDPPDDPAHPGWQNIKGTVGNQYLRVSEMMGSGMPRSSLEWQIVARTRPGTVDTSALPNDGVTNPGTMNAIINFGRRPRREHEVTRWHRAASCPPGAVERQCWCEPGKPGKCWDRRTETEMVPNLLKGGEDSIGLRGGVQRVYFGIGSCSEQCLINHVPDLRQADPKQRNYGQSPFDIGQCRRDCPNFRAIEDRVDDIIAFLLSARPSDLYRARGYGARRDLEVELEQQFGQGAVDRGRALFAQNCARCHSSQAGPFDAGSDFHATDPDDPTLRLDWMGNDQPTPVTEVGTHDARALHSNHMSGHIWHEFGSDTLRARPPVAALDELRKNGGRGYFRNISLLSLWAHAPFMHNNAIGPELCGGPDDKAYVSPYVGPDGLPLPPDRAPACWPYDPSVEGRYRLFLASVDLLLDPDERAPKVTAVSEDLILDVVPKMDVAGHDLGLGVVVPPGVPQAALGSLRYKDLLEDSVLEATDPDRLRAKYRGLLNDGQLDALIAGLSLLRRQVFENDGDIVRSLSAQWPLVETYYANSKARLENAGHTFGENLSDEDKQALTAFLATL